MSSEYMSTDDTPEHTETEDLQPETQAADPLETELGDDGQGDIAESDIPRNRL